MNLKARLFAILLIAPMAVPAVAQDWSAQAIEIDAFQPTSEGGLLIVAAYQPDTGAAPRLFGDTSVGRQAVEGAGGLIKPSIILGRIDAGEEARFGITSLLPQTVQEIGVRYDDVAARVALKQSQPDIFRQLVTGGHIDPPDERALKVALQSELQRMNCYRSGIDGAWGPGSRRSVTSYFEKRSGADWPDQSPTVDLFREVILNEDVRCEAPVVAAAPRSNAQRRTTRTARRTTNRVARQTPTTRTRKPARQAAKPKVSLDAGIGVFR